MWIYSQSAGSIAHGGGDVLASGYAGAGIGKNNPAAQHLHNVGPIPQGRYTIGAPIGTPTHGPYVLPLTPDPGNTMFGRSEFLIHGDSASHPGKASEGCIILPRPTREAIGGSSDPVLLVIA